MYGCNDRTPAVFRLMNMFHKLDHLTCKYIIEFCALAPSARHNGIACCSRRLNACWRAMHLKIRREFMKTIIDFVMSIGNGEVLMVLLDYQDIQ